jgi:hypothetical protein
MVVPRRNRVAIIIPGWLEGPASFPAPPLELVGRFDMTV